MKIPKLNKLLIIILSGMILAGCNNYELVNTNENLVVKKNEVKTFESEIEWSGLNISIDLKVKHLDGRFYYKIVVEDLGGEPIQEQDYFQDLSKANLRLIIQDIDDFEILNPILIPFREFNNLIGADNKTPYSLEKQGSLEMDEETYLQIAQINIGTNGI
tara:strand:+ start:1013 stop:1492 length:480 start_codon:yes stop_codon:yes gene_type:complete